MSGFQVKYRKGAAFLSVCRSPWAGPVRRGPSRAGLVLTYGELNRYHPTRAPALFPRPGRAAANYKHMRENKKENRFCSAPAAALLLFAFLSGAAASPVRLALIEGEQEALTMQLVQPLERALREAGPGAEIRSADEVMCVFGGGEYRLQPPPGAGVPGPASGEAAALESAAEVLFVYPPDQSLLEAIKKAAADPATFRMADSIDLTGARAELSVENRPDGGVSVLLRAGPGSPVPGRPHRGLAAYYRVRWKDGEHILLVVGRAYGGLGRLAAAVAREGKEQLTGVARGGTFGGNGPDARGRALAEALERAGLKYSAVSTSEIENWSELETYRGGHPDGIQYLSANLIYSSAPAQAVLPPYAVFSASGTRVALIGLTPEVAGRLLAPSGLKGFELTDPVAAVIALLPRVRAAADVVVVLSQLDASDNARLASSTRGIDLILADDAPFLTFSPPPAAVLEETGRPPFDNALPPVRAYWPALNIVEVDRKPAGAGADWKVAERAVLLDDEFVPAPGFPEAELKPFAADRPADAVLIPAAREVFPDRARTGLPIYESRDFWTLAAALLAERTGAEAGLLQVQTLPSPTVGAVRGSLARQWLAFPDEAVVVSVPGSLLQSLAEEAAGQKDREAAGFNAGGRLRMAVSGFDLKKRLVRGIPFNPNDRYLLATSRSAAQTLELRGPKPAAGAPGVGDAVLEALREVSAKAGGGDWRAWMSGAPVSGRGLWKVDFRDISLNVRQTRLERSARFDAVPNSRIQGMNEFMAGGTLKTDAEYQRGDYKWTNTLELEYAKDRLHPRGAPATTNLTANRFMLLTLATRRAGDVPYAWLAHSWGPSLGVQTDGEFQALSGLKRKQTYSAFPGVEFYGGSVVETLELTANLTRDLSRDPDVTRTGLRARALISAPAGPPGARLSAEVWNNFFFRSRNDVSTDLRVEGQATAKFSVPLGRSLVISPFIDLYWLELEGRPAWGHSLMTGISIGFSRLWKPQYEGFW